MRVPAIDEIRNRLEKYPEVPIHVYARGSYMMGMAKEMCEEFSNCTVKRHQYKLGWDNACRFTILKEQF